MPAIRLGDIIDDFCPRCRLLTNHSVMALVGEDVKKVICRTCNHTHDYKFGKGTEKKKAKASAYEQVLASVLAGKSTEEPPKVERVVRPKRALSRSLARPPARPRHHPSRPR